MEQRSFGSSGLNVSVVGLGAGHIGSPDMPEHEVERLLCRTLDLGITLIDTAPGYGLSEERIGRHLAHRRQQFVLSTKCGYGVPGVADWTGECIRQGIDLALRRLRTDVLDIVHLHSCPAAVLARGEVVEELARAAEAGKVRVAAYSGDAVDLDAALQLPALRAIQCSINFCDQRALLSQVPLATSRGMGVIAKRPLANAPWRFAERPVGHYAETYWERLQVLSLEPGALSWPELALRFVLSAPGVSSCIVGTSNADHLEANVGLASKGPLPPDHYEAIRERFLAVGSDWVGQV